MPEEESKALTIIEEMDAIIANFEASRTKMASSAIQFKESYDKYVTKTMRDGSILKRKMKEMVIKGSTDEIG